MLELKEADRDRSHPAKTVASAGISPQRRPQPEARRPSGAGSANIDCGGAPA